MIAIDLRSGDGRQAGNIEQILHRERHASQRALHSGRIHHGRPCPRSVCHHRGKGIQRGVDPFDTRQAIGDDR